MTKSVVQGGEVVLGFWAGKLNVGVGGGAEWHIAKHCTILTFPTPRIWRCPPKLFVKPDTALAGNLHWIGLKCWAIQPDIGEQSPFHPSPPQKKKCFGSSHVVHNQTKAFSRKDGSIKKRQTAEIHNDYFVLCDTTVLTSDPASTF